MMWSVKMKIGSNVIHFMRNQGAISQIQHHWQTISPFLFYICAIFCNWHFMAFKYQTNINFNSVDIHILDSVTIRNIRIFMISYDKLFHFVEFSIAIPTYLFYWPFLLSRVANHSLLLLCVATKKRTTAIPSNRMKSRVDEVEISTSSSGW